MNGKVNKKNILRKLVDKDMRADGTIDVQEVLMAAKKIVRSLPRGRRQAVYANDVQNVASVVRAQRGMEKSWTSRAPRKDIRFGVEAIRLAAALIEECGSIEKGISLLESFRLL